MREIRYKLISTPGTTCSCLLMVFVLQSNKCIIELKKFLLTACQDKNVQASLNSLLEEQSNDVGLLVSQRVVNLPPQLLPHLYDSLFDEILWATEDEVRW